MAGQYGRNEPLAVVSTYGGLVLFNTWILLLTVRCLALHPASTGYVPNKAKLSRSEYMVVNGKTHNSERPLDKQLTAYR